MHGESIVGVRPRAGNGGRLHGRPRTITAGDIKRLGLAVIRATAALRGRAEAIDEKAADAWAAGVEEAGPPRRAEGRGE